MTAFDQDTALESVAPGRWRGLVSDSWDIVRGPNGGYIASFPLRAMAAESPFAQPRSLTVNYLSRPAPGPADVEVEVLRAGRSHASLSARMVQAGSIIAATLGTFGSRPGGGPRSVQGAMPEVAPPEASGPMQGHPVHSEMPFRRQFEYRVPPELEIRHSGGPATIGGWMRLIDRDLDEMAVALFMDSWPPAMFVTLGGGYAPTLELTVHWRSRPRGRWHLALFRSRFLMDGYVEEDGELWTEDGDLVAQSRQLALFVPPEAM